MSKQNQSKLLSKQASIFYKSSFKMHLRTNLIVKCILNKYKNNRIHKLMQAKSVLTKLHTLLLTNRALHNKIALSDLKSIATSYTTHSVCSMVLEPFPSMRLLYHFLTHYLHANLNNFFFFTSYHSKLNRF